MHGIHVYLTSYLGVMTTHFARVTIGVTIVLLFCPPVVDKKLIVNLNLLKMPAKMFSTTEEKEGAPALFLSVLSL